MTASAARLYSTSRVVSSLRRFALGKLVSAPLSLVLVVLLSAAMSTREYAAYVAAAAVLELGVAFGTLGIDWVAHTAVAGAQSRASPRALSALVRRMMGLAVLPYLVLAALLWASADALSAGLSHTAGAPLLRLYAVLLLMEGPHRMHRDHLLAVLMEQGAVQISQIVRVTTMLGALGVALVLAHPVQARDVALFEIVACCASMLCTLSALWGVVGNRVSGPIAGDAFERGLLGRKELRLAASAYASFMLTLLLGNEMTATLVARYLGEQATASFGFMTRILETVRRLMPMDLFYGVIRPVTIGRFHASAQDSAVLIQDANLFLRANLLVLGAGLAMAMASGDRLIGMLSHGQVVAPAFVFAALLLTVATHSLRRTLELIALVSGHAKAFLRASLSALVAPPGIYLALAAGTGLYGVAATLVGADLLFCGVVIVQLRTQLAQPIIQTQAAIKLALACGAAVALSLVLAPTGRGVAGVAGASLLALGLYAAAVWRVRAVTKADVRLLQRVLRPGR
jgi:hypothetical protein